MDTIILNENVRNASAFVALAERAVALAKQAGIRADSPASSEDGLYIGSFAAPARDGQELSQAPQVKLSRNLDDPSI